MTFTIFSHVNHYTENNAFYAYAPYVREMNIWSEYIDQLSIVAPLEKISIDKIDIAYSHNNVNFYKINNFNITSGKEIFNTLFQLPKILITIYRAMKKADHIHLRCPGNVGLLACFVQILFPNKKKTAKYAGNWDPQSKQPWSYKLQQWILSNTFLTKNMQVLVYGEWENSTKNIKPFFTATYSEKDKQPIIERNLTQTIDFLFVGTLSEGKRPLYAVQLVEKLIQKGIKAQLTLYGEGKERTNLEKYIAENQLSKYIFLKGNQPKEVVMQSYQKSHFMILASKSEGWPKVVAEAMFWGCVPLSTRISCVPNMLDNGKRGILLDLDINQDADNISKLISYPIQYQEMIENGVNWSREYTIEKFEEEIKKLL
ncbi:MAG: glycosyltransferase [Bacteroidota bacterium]|nr:glycosyltransferase [Bacteroidota bacterium]